MACEQAFLLHRHTNSSSMFSSILSSVNCFPQIVNCRISNLHADHVEFKIQPVVPSTHSLTVFGSNQFAVNRLLFEFVEVSHRTKHGRVQFSCEASESQVPFTFILKCWRYRSGDTNCEGFQSIPPFPFYIKGLFEGICKCAPVRKSKSQLQIQ